MVKKQVKQEIRLGLFEYYAITFINSVGVCVFLSCCYFWAKQRFGFSDPENLGLAALQGFVYIFLPTLSGKLSDRIGYDRIIAMGTAGSGLAMLLGCALAFSWTPFLIAGLLVLFSACTWPSLEACVLHAKGKLSLPNRVGLYNIDWSLGNVVGYFLGGALYAWQRDSIVWVPVLIFAGQFLWLRRPWARAQALGQSAADASHEGIKLSQAVKNRFMHLSWLANAMGYFLMFVLGAVLPYLSERLHLRPEYMIWLACTTFFVRTVGFTVLWQWEGWHYKMPLLQAVLWLSPFFLAGIFVSPTGPLHVRVFIPVRLRREPVLQQLHLLLPELRGEQG